MSIGQFLVTMSLLLLLLLSYSSHRSLMMPRRIRVYYNYIKQLFAFSRFFLQLLLLLVCVSSHIYK